MPFKSVERPASLHLAPDDTPATGRRDLLVERNHERGVAIVDELTRITAAMEAGLPTTSAEILAVADRIAELRTAVEFSDLVDGL